MVVKATSNMRRKLTNYYMLLVNNLDSSSPVLRKSHQIRFRKSTPTNGYTTAKALLLS
jgi:hypothetical protein